MPSPTTKPLIASAVLASLLAVAGPAGADHAWGPYHWARTTAQFTLKLGNNLTTSNWASHLGAASIDWNSPELFGASFTPVLTAIVAGQSNKNCALVLGTSQVCNGKYGRNGWLGLASISIVDGVHIRAGSAKMNDTYFATATYNNNNERRHVVCQEIAHTFGLDHQSEDGSSLNTCMDYFSNTGANATSSLSTRPNLHDFEQLAQIYAHPDNSSTVAAATTPTAASVADISDDPQSWGQLVRQSANGRSSVYQRHNQDGSMTLTHVYWTLETAARCPACDHREHRHD